MPDTEIKVEGEALPGPAEEVGVYVIEGAVVPDLGGLTLGGTRAEGQSFMDVLMQKEDVKDGKTPRSSQGVALGRKLRPFNFDTLARFQSVNVHHARCLLTRRNAIIGLGFETPNDKKRKMAKKASEPPPADLPISGEVAKIDKTLDPLCEHSWQSTIMDVVEDMLQCGNGYLEVVREGLDGPIVGIYHIPAKEVWVVIEDHRYNRHYMVQSGEDSAGVRYFAKFGDKEGFFARGPSRNSFGFDTPSSLESDQVSEVIHIPMPTSLSRWYGFPDFLAAVPSIELVSCIVQHEYDFYLNRGVPEFMLFILGQLLHKKDKDKIEAAMRSTIGLGNQHKSLLVNLPGGKDTMLVQLEKLAMESKGDGSQFAANSEALALKIVTAHGVPPLLAGIQIPGKLGAANEMVQAMQAFQVLSVGPLQRLVSRTLYRTLGQDPSLGLGEEDFVLNTIVEAIDVEKADTVARMKQTPQEAADEGRDLKAGVKKEDLGDEEKGRLVRTAVDAMLEHLCVASGV